MEASLVTRLIRCTTPCFFNNASHDVWCPWRSRDEARKTGIAGFGTAQPQNKRALCIRDDGARADAGIALEDAGELESRRLRLAKLGGARVASIQAIVAAATAGLVIGDVITGLDGTDIANGTQLQQLIQKAEPGRAAVFSLFRDGQILTVSVTLGSRE